MALIALTAASLTFAGCGGKNADSDVSKPGQEAYYQSDDGSFHKVKSGQKRSKTLYYKDTKGDFHKKSKPAAATASSTDTQEEHQGAQIHSTQAAVNLVPQPSTNSISFVFNSSHINNAGKENLAEYATWLNANPDVSITIEGYCDERGSTEYNLALGDERAHKVRQVLIANNIAKSRIETSSFGENNPVCSEHTSSCWDLNRRGDIVNR
ncbi:MAG: OmpA family protein [Ghiorsea sp.]